MSGRRSRAAVKRDRGCTHASLGWGTHLAGWWYCDACANHVTKWPEGWITLEEAYRRVPRTRSVLSDMEETG